jgi:hypothetical protein
MHVLYYLEAFGKRFEKMSDEARFRVMQALWIDEQRGRYGLTIPELAAKTGLSGPTIAKAVRQLRDANPPLLVLGQKKHSQVDRSQSGQSDAAQVDLRVAQSASRDEISVREYGRLANRYLRNRDVVTDNPCTAVIILTVLRRPGSKISREDLINEIIDNYADPKGEEYSRERVASRLSAALEPNRYLQLDLDDELNDALTITERVPFEERYLVFLAEKLKSKR